MPLVRARWAALSTEVVREVVTVPECHGAVVRPAEGHGTRRRFHAAGNGSTEPYLNVAQDYFSELSRLLLNTSGRRRPSASCQDRRVSATRPTGGPDDTGTDASRHAAAAAHARRHEAPQHGRRHVQELRALGRRLQRVPLCRGAQLDGDQSAHGTEITYFRYPSKRRPARRGNGRRRRWSFPYPGRRGVHGLARLP